MAAAVADAHRRDWATVLAVIVRVTRDLDLAQECVQDAYARALQSWVESGVPVNPAAWLTTVARRRALDVLRRADTARRALPLLVVDDAVAGPGEHEPDLVDDRLRLVFTCCHPALHPDARVALTLRLVCGLRTAEVARAFLVSESTMAARLTRAKQKIAAARIPYRVPAGPELTERTATVLDVVHLVLTTGHTAPSGDRLVRDDLLDRAVELARLVRLLLPADPEVAALLGLVLLTDSRRATRVDAGGRLVLLPDQDRSRWSRPTIDEGVELVRGALRSGPPGRYAIRAAIAAAHAEAGSWDDTDWGEIVGLYDLLLARWPSPVVALNRGVAIGFHRGPAAGLTVLDGLADDPRLVPYPYLAAARADLLRRLGHTTAARLAYDEALLLTENHVERDFLLARRTDY